MAAAIAGLLVPLCSWFYAVDRTVPEPYLDEVFHVRQAQHYCAARFDVWDPKITTPPGLYLLSTLTAPILGCNISILRALGPLCLCALVPVLMRADFIRNPSISSSQHKALNIALFPPLFFFGALYYTDVASTLSVVIFYLVFTRSYQNGMPSIAQKTSILLLGLTSLLFRQTNIFWVAVFPACIVLVHELDRGHDAIKESMIRGSEGFGDSMYSIAKTSWKMGVVYSPSVSDAWLEGSLPSCLTVPLGVSLIIRAADYLKTSISITACALRTATRPRGVIHLISSLSPYLTLLTVFATFILINGSVVLGDRSNHVATVHLAQMLYLWPYLAFFSWPLLTPYLLSIPVSLLSRLSYIASGKTTLSFLRRHNVSHPRYWTVVLFTCVGIIVVKLNTIVHPFTLADNRHYTFYVFRLLLRPWYTRYLATPVYFLCAWACTQALGAGPSQPSTEYSTSTAASPKALAHVKALPVPDGLHAATTPFILIWLATTALQLVTAPLVEPRYFILPWVFWRMHLPLRPRGFNSATGSAGLDPRLYLETMWLLTVNAVTGYIFLTWGFAWAQEPGVVQRFMW